VRRVRDALRVQQVAGRIVDHASVERCSRQGPTLGEQLSDVADSGREPDPGAVEEMAVVLQHGPAPGTVDDDGLVPVAEGGEVRPRESARLVAQPGVRVQRPAARLPADLAHLVAVDLECPDRGVVDVREEAVHDAAPEQQGG
jgi:hypothetical protein